VSVDYRLLHHFRVSQRREMASRGELSVLRPGGHGGGEPDVDAPGVKPGVDEPRGDTPVVRASPPPLAEATRPQVLTHLLNEDR
jgi:hypothetical protein